MTAGAHAPRMSSHACSTWRRSVKVPPTENRIVNRSSSFVWVMYSFPVALRPSSIETLDLVFGSGMQVLGSGIAVVALMFGLGKVKAIEQWFGDKRHAGVHGLALWVKWGVPAGLAVSLGVYVWESM